MHTSYNINHNLYNFLDARHYMLLHMGYYFQFLYIITDTLHCIALDCRACADTLASREVKETACTRRRAVVLIVLYSAFLGCLRKLQPSHHTYPGGMVCYAVSYRH